MQHKDFAKILRSVNLPSLVQRTPTIQSGNSGTMSVHPGHPGWSVDHDRFLARKPRKIMIVARFSLQRTDQTLLAMTRVAFTKTVEHHVRRSTDTDSLHPLVPLIHISRTNTAEQPSLERTKNHHIFTSFNNRARGILALFFTSYREKEKQTTNKRSTDD